MRWDDLFADLEAQLAHLDRAERAAEIDERARAEFAALPLLARLRAAVGDPVRLRCETGVLVAGRLARVGPEWLLVDDAGRESVVPTAVLLSVTGTGRRVDTDDGGVVASRLGLRHALRGLARDRAGVQLLLRDGSTLAATIDRVGADYLEAAVHPSGEARRVSEVRDVVLVPFAALVVVRRGR